MIYHIIIPGIIIACIALYILVDTSESILGNALEQYTEPNWDQVKKRNIVKNSIPISLVEQNNSNCTVQADRFYQIIDHDYFVRAKQLANELQYDPTNDTLIISCDKLKGEKSKLHVWYAITDASRHAEKYQYFVTEWEN